MILRFLNKFDLRRPSTSGFVKFNSTHHPTYFNANPNSIIPIVFLLEEAFNFMHRLNVKDILHIHMYMQNASLVVILLSCQIVQHHRMQFVQG